MAECVVCGEPFRPDRSTQTICSGECRAEDKRVKDAGRRQSVNGGLPSFRDIGNRLGVSHGTAQTDYFSALEKLRAAVNKDDFR
jgi:hypothetical protein